VLATALHIPLTLLTYYWYDHYHYYHCHTKQRARLAALRHRAASATAIQSAWRARTARRDVGTARAHAAAAREVQRCFRGHLGRKAAERRRDWSATPPGPARVKLGLRLIEDTRASFARQQGEMDALHKVIRSSRVDICAL
jgi:hypothetical protein